MLASAARGLLVTSACEGLLACQATCQLSSGLGGKHLGGGPIPLVTPGATSLPLRHLQLLQLGPLSCVQTRLRASVFGAGRPWGWLARLAGQLRIQNPMRLIINLAALALLMRFWPMPGTSSRNPLGTGEPTVQVQVSARQGEQAWGGFWGVLGWIGQARHVLQ